ncbi:transglutaminase-like cysteine peptidase [Amphritea sp. HPY]|uniref:transglutaminase-like cysteine peptidase n=1 Tax=Amphritea sp. HPY TaxID=3421652 RepID=UPI003D7DFCAC
MEKLQSLAEQRYGEVAAETVSNWRAMLRLSSGLSESEKLFKINNFFNFRIRFDSDDQIWQQTDYWATPLETMAYARGDCEDLTIAKYASLRLLGIAPEKLKLTYVNANRGLPDNPVNQPHMVLTYYPDDNSSPLVLDNLVEDIRPVSERSDLQPVFSFNDQGFWVAGVNRTSEPASRLPRWGDVLSRMQSEGLL